MGKETKTKKEGNEGPKKNQIAWGPSNWGEKDINIYL